MARTFDDRFDPSTFENDEPVHVWGIEVYGPEGELWISERLWSRLCMVAGAFELHLLPLLAGPSSPAMEDKVMLNGKQCEGLLDEIAFVGRVLDDPLVREQLAALAPLVRSASRGSGLGVEFP